MQQANEDHTLIKVEFLCANCKDGKHGCAKLWRGLRLEIRCCCSCTASRGITAAREIRIRDGGFCKSGRGGGFSQNGSKIASEEEAKSEEVS